MCCKESSDESRLPEVVSGFSLTKTTMDGEGQREHRTHELDLDLLPVHEMAVEDQAILVRQHESQRGRMRRWH